ncbi:RagB/SusD family nutrient uptake outer membrane protein [Flavobacterium pedocola]
MKKILLSGLILASLLTSCDKEDLKLYPYNAVTDQTVLLTDKDFNNAILGGYSYMIKNLGAEGYGQELLIDSEVATDNVIINTQGRLSNRDGYRFTSTPNSSHFDFYNSAYRAVYMANLVMENLGKLPEGASKDNYEGEARFIRAINHLELLRNYSKIPTQSGDALGSLGVVYKESTDITERPSRLTVQQSYDKVLADLMIAKDKIGATVVQGRANKAAVYTLLSRVYLYMGDYANCVANADLAIANFSGTVSTRAQFYTSASSGLWEDSNTGGVVFKLRIDQIDATTPGVAYSQAVGASIRSEYVITKELFDLYQATDVRKAAYIKTAPFSGNNYNNIAKYDGRGSGLRNLVDIKVLRIEEAYLNKAEAEYRLSGGGLAALDAVRAQRYLPFVSGGETGTALLDAILLERRLEFAFEMDRFYTLKRLNLPVQRSLVDGHFADGTGTPSEAPTLAAGDFRWQFPIPQNEIDLNNNIQQNPGY